MFLMPLIAADFSQKCRIVNEKQPVAYEISGCCADKLAKPSVT